MHVIATTLVAFILFAWSVAVVSVELRTAPSREFALALEKNSRPMVSSRAEAALNDNKWCTREAVQSNVTIRLALLDAALRTNEVQEREAALARAHETLRQGLLCFPRDGNLWLRLAMVENAQGRDATRGGEMLAISLANTPSEGWIIIPRIHFAARLGKAATGADAVLETDVRNLLRFGELPDVVSLYAEADENLREKLLSGLQDVSFERGLTIDAAIKARIEEGKKK